VEAHSDGPGRGSEFIVTLPRVAAPEQARVEPARAAASATAGEAAGAAKDRKTRIMVVEDQADARRALQRLLQIWGHQVDAAENGAQAIELAATHRPQIALVDVGLPGMDGYELARRLRAVHGEALRLIALTGYGQPEDRERAYGAGFHLHLVKPVDREQLLRALGEEPLAGHLRATPSA
jgi:CheY-like chemotaxis protein